MTKSSNISAIETATKRTWKEWCDLLDKAGASGMQHKDIAELAYNSMGDSVESPGWWSQSVTVAYEQHIGRRVPGQREDGSFEVSVSKTFNGTKIEALECWVKLVGKAEEFGGIKFASPATTTTTDNWGHWRVKLTDGSKIEVSTTDKGPGKSNLTVSSLKLKTAEDIEAWRSYWKNFLENLNR